MERARKITRAVRDYARDSNAIIAYSLPAAYAAGEFGLDKSKVGMVSGLVTLALIAKDALNNYKDMREDLTDNGIDALRISVPLTAASAVAPAVSFVAGHVDTIMDKPLGVVVAGATAAGIKKGRNTFRIYRNRHK